MKFESFNLAYKKIKIFQITTQTKIFNSIFIIIIEIKKNSLFIKYYYNNIIKLKQIFGLKFVFVNLIQ